MNYQFMVCPWCKRSVGFLSCCTCHKKYDLVICNGLSVNCPLCIDCKLDTYYQNDEDLLVHQQCHRNYKRMFYHCQCCKGYFCNCVEKQLKKQIILNPCPCSKNKK
ncbi:unnamed protein product [Paramecium pentaurelia]|uniref:Uncharacterized protein n=1 Tax=Paramecium pentaurelia TaxID=43138 RepID=A0A8S1XHD0_9CILI|nr:unnamed protein product [Paramecium pentaurelia]